MARPRGALNRKTRRALYEAAQEYDDHGKAAINYLARTKATVPSSSLHAGQFRTPDPEKIAQLSSV